MRTVRILARCLLSFVIIVGMLPGCIKYYRVAKTEFPQGKEQVEEQFEARDDIKSVSIYDQFETTAFFDVMWFSEVIRDAYVDLYSSMNTLENVYEKQSTINGKTNSAYEQNKGELDGNYKEVVSLRKDLDKKLKYIQENSNLGTSPALRTLNGRILINTLLVILLVYLVYVLIFDLIA